MKGNKSWVPIQNLELKYVIKLLKYNPKKAKTKSCILLLEKYSYTNKENPNKKYIIQIQI